MEQGLQGKVVLITGGARRVGAAIVRQLHAAGANLAIHYRSSSDEATALCSELNVIRSNSAITLAADLLQTGQLASLVDAALAAFGRLDVLINNASSFYPTPIGEITTKQWDDLIGTNLRAPMFLSQAAAPALAASEGLILNIVDIHGLRPLKQHPVYSCAKAGLIMLTQSLARELAPRVRVNAIAPGPVLFPESGLTPEAKQMIIDKTLLKRRGSPDDIAKAALFFVQDAPYVTGQILSVDGGRSANT
jgi:pteridine reductase